MISSILQERTKIDIRIISQMERASQTGEEVHVYKSQIFEILENGELEIIMPIEGGKVILLPLGLRYEFVFYTEAGLYKCIGPIKERYKTENRYMLRVELNTALDKVQRREYYRMDCILDTTYFCITQQQAQMDKAEDILEDLRDTDFYIKQKKGIIVDISGGGVRFVTEEKHENNTYVLLIVNLVTEKGNKQYYLPGHLLRSIRLDTKEIKYETRIEFIFKDVKVREEIIRYIFAEERKARKK